MPKAKTYERDHIQAFIDSGGRQTGQRFIKFRGYTIEDVEGKKIVKTPDSKTVVAQEDVNTILKDMYFDPKTGYLGTRRMYDSARQLYDGITRDDVLNFLVANSAHQQHRAKKPQRTIKPIIAKRPASRWQVDLIDFSPTAGSNNGKHFALTCIDLFSKYAWIRALRNKTGPVVADAMREIINEEWDNKHRKPTIIQTDNGSEFKGEFDELLKDEGIKHVFSSSYAPQSQGAVERFNGTIKLIINRYLTANQTKKWVDVADDLVQSYNRTIHKTTNKRATDLHKMDASAKDQKEADDNIVKQANKSKANSSDYMPFQVNDYVRVALQTFAEIRKQQFRKSYERNWTRETYTIDKVVHKKGKAGEITNYYRLKDEDGEKVPGLFHISRLLYTVAPDKQIEQPKKRARPERKEQIIPEPCQSIAERVKARRNPIVVD